jgi:hypothetical protein
MTKEMIENSYCALFGLEYSDCLMSSIRYFTAGNINVTASFQNDGGVTVTNISRLTGEMNHVEMDMGFSEFRNAFNAWEGGELIQDAFSNLSADDREFIVSGITAEEWNLAFAE